MARPGVASLSTLIVALVMLAASACGESRVPAHEPLSPTATTQAERAVVTATATPYPCPFVNGESPGGLVVRLALDGNAAEFQAGQTISMVLSITNCRAQAISRIYRDSQAYEFIVIDDMGEAVWFWSHDVGFLQTLTEATIDPGETVTYTAMWDQTTPTGELVPPGRYEVLGIDVGCEQDSSSCGLSTSKRIEIVP